MRRLIAAASTVLAGCLGVVICTAAALAQVGTWSIPVFIDDWPSDTPSNWTEQVNGIAHDDQGCLFFATAKAALTPPFILKLPAGTDLSSYIMPFLIQFPPFPADGNAHDLADGATISWGMPDELSDFGDDYRHYGDIDQAGGFLFVPVEQGSPNAIAVFRTSDLAYLGFAPTAPGQASAGWVAIDPIPPDPQSHPDRRYLYMSNSYIDGYSYPDAHTNQLYRYTVDFDVLSAGDVPGAIRFLDRVAVKNGDGSPLEPPIGVESAQVGYAQGGVFSPWGDLYIINGDNSTPVEEQHAGIHLFRPDPEGSGAFLRVADSVNGAPGFNFMITISDAEEPEGIDWWDVALGDLPVATQLHAILLNTNTDTDNLYIKHYTVNYPPVADAGDDQTVDEGDEVTLSGTFTDQNGGSHTFVWEPVSATNGQQVPDATTESFTFTALDNGVYTFRFTVTDDQGAPGSDTVVVTAVNVPPTLTGPGIASQPNAEFILPVVHAVTFAGDFTDPGILDTHAAYWDWGDGTDSTGIVTEIDGSGDATRQHTYALPGDYTIMLIVTDKDGGHDSGSVQVHVADAGEALGIFNAYIQSLPDSDFKNNAAQRKQAFDAKFTALEQMLAAGDYQGLIQSMNTDIRSKFDGLVGGKANDDWIVQDLAVQTHLCQKVDDITAYLRFLQADGD